MWQVIRSPQGRAKGTGERTHEEAPNAVACVRPNRSQNTGRIVFLRLFEDLVDELTLAVNRRVAQGHTKTAIAHKGGIAPAVLSRVLTGRSGTNLRTVAAVLAGTDHRLKVMAVPCEHLGEVQKVWSCPPIERDDYYHFVFSDGLWHEGIDATTPDVALITASGDEAGVL